MNSKDKLIVALDVSTLREAERLVKQLTPLVKFFKVGKELFTSEGPKAIQMVHNHRAKVFLDLKFHDIPNTVGAACAAAARLKIFMLNVHALGGKNMMIRAVRSVHQAAGHGAEGWPRRLCRGTPLEAADSLVAGRPLVLAVTVLTSLKDRDLKEVGIGKKLDKEVVDLALLANDCGLDGVVASAHEIHRIRKAVKNDFLIVTPGVRPVWAAHGDQKRIMTPKEALEEGADYIVVGRSITQSARPRAAAERLLKEIGRVYGSSHG